MSAVRIIGIGSAHGADRAGWLAVEALRRSGLVQRYPPGSLSLYQCRVPAALYQALAGSRCAILIDALPGEPGSLQSLSPQQLQTRTDPASVHGIGVADMLALVAALEAQLPALTVLGIGVDPGDAGATEQLIEALLPELSRRVQCIVAEHLEAGGAATKKHVRTARKH